MAKMESCAPLSPASVRAILAETGHSKSQVPALIKGVSDWLFGIMEHTVNRARAKPLTLGDVNKLERAFARFHATVEALQDRTNPPPLIPTKDCQTDWEFWIATHKALGFKRGRRESVDWHLIGGLIAFYETFSLRRASASQPRGPTMRFLETALGALADHAPEDVRSYFVVPNNESLRQQLVVLRQGYFRFVGDELAKLLTSTSG